MTGPLPPAAGPPPLDAERYARAERFLPWNVGRLAFRTEAAPHWIAGSDRFWYKVRTPAGAEFVLVDPARRQRAPAFDHVRLAAALTAATGTACDPAALPFAEIAVADDGASIRFVAAGTAWSCDLAGYGCVRAAATEVAAPDEAVSPDGRWAVVARDGNLWLRSRGGGERRLTDDGAAWNDYGSWPDTLGISGRLHPEPMPPAVVWSPDSRRLLTHRLDQRSVAEVALVRGGDRFGRGRPTVLTCREAWTGDEHLPLATLVTIDVDDGRVVEVAGGPLLCAGPSPIEAEWVWWGDDGRRAYAVRVGRGDRWAELVEIDPASGAARRLLREESATYVDLAADRWPPSVRVLAGGAEVLWWSERDGWGHLYLLDTATGSVRRQVTAGAWQVRALLHVDEERRLAYLLRGGREPGRDPYLRHLYRVGLDRGEIVLLTPEDADHEVALSPSGAFFVDTPSRVDLPPRTVVRSAAGELVMEIEAADLDRLTATGWTPPERFTAEAADGETAIFGLVFRPTDFDPGRRYPVVESIYGGPQRIQTPKRLAIEGEREADRLWQAQALAELGFLVVMVDGAGTPYRAKALHDGPWVAGFGESRSLADHVAALRCLAAARPEMDLDRLGVSGNSWGGYWAARAMLVVPELYKVAVSLSGNHDHWLSNAFYTERYQGVPSGPEDDNYRHQSNQDLADRLAGKLFLICGELDDNVHPAMTLRFADALIAADKDFDLLVVPGRNHETIERDPYVIRRQWDYLVRHLLGAAPPPGYRMAAPAGDT